MERVQGADVERVFVRGEQVQRMMWLYRLEKSERREEWGGGVGQGRSGLR